jgi:hypothetical protein
MNGINQFYRANFVLAENVTRLSTEIHNLGYCVTRWDAVL